MTDKKIFHHPTSQKFAYDWQGGEGDKNTVTDGNMITGQLDNKQGSLGTPQVRQDSLTGLIINTALMTSVYEVMKESDNPIRDLLNSRMLREPYENMDTVNAWEGIEADIEDAKENGNNDALFKAVLELQEEGLITRHQDLVFPRDWEPFVAERESGKNIPDPRIEEAQKKVDDYFTIVSSGEKAIDSIERKIETSKAKAAKKGKEFSFASDIRDSVRILVGAKTPEYAEDFYKVLEHLRPPKDVGNQDYVYPRVYKEDWMLKHRGLYDMTSYIAMDRLHGEHKDENDNDINTGGDAAYSGGDGHYYMKGINGIVAELRMVPQELVKCEKITHSLYTVERAVDKLSAKNASRSDGTFVGEVITDDDMKELQSLYVEEKAQFEAEKEKYGLDYDFPEMPTKEIVGDSYTKTHRAQNYVNDCILLNQRITFDAMASEKLAPEWKDEIVKKAYQEQAPLDHADITFIDETLLAEVMPDADRRGSLKDAAKQEFDAFQERMKAERRR